jgi:hypothetical protein
MRNPVPALARTIGLLLDADKDDPTLRTAENSVRRLVPQEPKHVFIKEFMQGPMRNEPALRHYALGAAGNGRGKRGIAWRIRSDKGVQYRPDISLDSTE